MRKIFCISVWLLLLPLTLFGQIRPLADQYLMNFFQINPAVAGISRYDPLVINAREQGMKWDHAPASQSVTWQGKLFKEKAFYNPKGFLNRGQNAYGKVGIGAGLFNYSYGSVSQTGLHLDYAYHVFMGQGRLSFGLSPVLMLFRANFSDDSFVFDENPDDLWLPQGNDPISLSILDFNAGVHYYSENLTLGFSCLQMFSSSISLKGEYGFPSTGGSIENPDLTRSLSGYGAWLFKISRDVRVEPMLMLKYNTNYIDPFRFDLTATAYIRDQFDTGFSYRWNEGIAAFCSVRVDKMHFRYLFELPLSGKTPRGFTAHMIQLGIDIGQNIK